MIKSRGKLIVFEGLDRTGKSTLANNVLNYLIQKNIPCSSMRFPDRSTMIGRLINDYLQSNADYNDQTIHLLFSANRWECQKSMLNTLNQGQSIICDRYWYSGVAYSMAKGLNDEWCMKSDEGLLHPDLVIYLTGNPQILQKRGGYGEQRFEKVEFQMKVKDAYQRIWQKYDKNLQKIQVQNKSVEKLNKQIEHLLNEVYKFV